MMQTLYIKPARDGWKVSPLIFSCRT